MRRKNSNTQLNLFHKAPESQRGDDKLSVVAEDWTGAKQKPRMLKIQYGEYNGSRRRHPVLRLAGFWLKDFGFAIGDTVELTGADSGLLIKKLKKAGG